MKIATAALAGALLAAGAARATLVEEVPAPIAAPWGIAFDAFGRRYVTGASFLAIDSDPPVNLSVLGAVDLRDVAFGAGLLWITEPSQNKVWLYDTADDSIVSYAAPGTPIGIAVDFAGNAWFTEYAANKIGKLTPAGVLTEYPIPTASSHPQGIAPMSSGSMVFVEQSGNKIGIVNKAGSITELPATPGAGALLYGAAASANTIAVTEPGLDKIGIYTISGLTEVALPHAITALRGILYGPDGAFWFVEQGSTVSRAGRITPAGAVVDYPLPSGLVHPKQIAASPDGSLWIAEQSTGKLAHVVPHTSGDVNGDGAIGVADVFYLINYLFAGGPAPK